MRRGHGRQRKHVGEVAALAVAVAPAGIAAAPADVVWFAAVAAACSFARYSVFCACSSSSIRRGGVRRSYCAEHEQPADLRGGGVPHFKSHGRPPTKALCMLLLLLLLLLLWFVSLLLMVL